MTQVTEKTVEDQAAALLTAVKALPSKSKQIRYLAGLGWKNGPIAKYLTAIYYPDGSKEVRYQHVRNVLNQKVIAD